MAELDQRIRELNEERAEMYKTQSENAQRLVTLNERLRLAETSDKENAEKQVFFPFRLSRHLVMLARFKS